MENIKSKMENDFRFLQDEVDKFKVCKDVWIYQHEFNFDNFASQMFPTKTIEDELKNLRLWENKVNNNIKTMIPCGLIWVSGKKLREDLSNMIRLNQNRLKEHLHK